jgi:hypothetical protein
MCGAFQKSETVNDKLLTPALWAAKIEDFGDFYVAKPHEKPPNPYFE